MAVRPARRRAAAPACNLGLLAQFGVTDLDRIRPADRVALLGVALAAGADTPLVWVDTAHPTRRAALGGIWPDGANPLPSLLVDVDAADAGLERIDYHPVSGMTVAADWVPLTAAADPHALVDLLDLLADSP